MVAYSLYYLVTDIVYNGILFFRYIFGQMDIELRSCFYAQSGHYLGYSPSVCYAHVEKCFGDQCFDFQ